MRAAALDRNRRASDRKDAAPAIAATVLSPIFYCEGPGPLLGFGSGNLGVTAPDGEMHHVYGPLFDFCVIVGASVGAVLTFEGDTLPDMANTRTWIGWDVSAGGTWCSAVSRVTLAAFGATFPLHSRSPYPFWRMRLVNGATAQVNGTFDFMVSAGGW